MYTRLYCQKNNTIFYTNNSGSANVKNGNINTGKNPILELRDGDGESIILFKFDITDLEEMLTGVSFNCNLKLYDSGAIYEPKLAPKLLNVYYFEGDFVEGDGWSFESDGLSSFSNWNFKNESELWGTVFDTPFKTYQLNSSREDITLDVSDIIAASLNSTKSPVIAFKIANVETSGVLKAKFITSKHSGTIFKPYLEFFIENEIIDYSQFTYAGYPSYFYAKTSNGDDLSELPRVNILKENGVEVTPTIIATKHSKGVYKVEYTPAQLWVNSILTAVWESSGGKILSQRAFQVNDAEFMNLRSPTIPDIFYCQPFYTRPKILKGDKAFFEIISRIGKKAFIVPGFEFKVESSAGFQMIPWTKANVLADKIYFVIDTSFFYEDLNYEIFVRLNQDNVITTSDVTYSFKVMANQANHLREIKTTPYNNRI